MDCKEEFGDTRDSELMTKMWVLTQKKRTLSVLVPQGFEGV